MDLVLRQSVSMVAVGVVAGAATAWGAGRLLARVVDGMRPTDPSTAAAMTSVLVAAAILASFVPGTRRASRVDVLEALRQDSRPAGEDRSRRQTRVEILEGVAFDGNRLSRTGATAQVFKYLPAGESAKEKYGDPGRMGPLFYSRVDVLGVSVSLAGLHPRGRMSTFLATVAAGGNADKED
jgi:hypothetical protein